MASLSRLIFGLCLCASWTGIAAAQHSPIVGKVIDDRLEAVPGANVFVRGTNIGTISGTDGRFSLTVVADGTAVLVCSFVGFKPAIISVVLPVLNDVLCQLNPDTISTGEVVVTASRRPQLASEVPSSLSVIPAEYLTARSVESLDVAIRNTTGVQLQGNQVNIRGSSGFAFNTGSRVLLLVDGMPLLSPDTDGIPFESFPIDQIRQIEILKGPGSALYGSGALGGVINLISNPVGPEPQTRIRTSLGYYQPFRYSEWTGRWPDGKNGAFNASVSASHARRFSSAVGAWASVTARIDQGYLNKGGAEVVNAYSKLSARLSDKTTLDILGGYLVRRKDNFLFWNGLGDALNPGTIAISRSNDPTGSSDNRTSTASLLPQLRTFVGSSGVLTSRGRLYALMIRPIDENGKPKPLAEGTLGFRFGAESQYTALHRLGQLIVGATVDANVTRSSFFVSESGAETGRQPEAAVYFQAERHFSPTVSAVGGLRADVFWISTIERVGSLSPKLGISYRLSESTSFRASWGKGFRVPSVAERFTDDQSFFPVFRNLDLRPERSTSYELGVRTRTDGPIAITVDGALFWYELDDLIEPRFVQQIEPGKPRLLGFQFINLDRGRVRGLELDLQAVVTRRLTGRIGYTLLDSKDYTSDRALAYRPRHLVTAGATMSGSRVGGGVDFRFVSRPDVIDSDFTRFVPDADVLVRTVVSDVHVAWTVGRFVLGAIVNNVFNYYYLDRPALLAAPREFVIQASTNF